LKGLQEGVINLAFSPDGEQIITGSDFGGDQGNEAKVWDARTGALLLDLTKGNGSYRLGSRMSVAFSPDGKQVVVAGARSMTTPERGVMATVRDTQTGATLVELKAPQETPESMAVSPDGTRIALGYHNNLVTIWDAEKGTPLLDLKGHTSEINSVAFSPDGKRIVTGSGDRTVRIWDARTGTTLAELKGHTGAVTSVSFSADGTRLLTAGGEVFVWDAPIPKPEVEGILDEEELAYRRLHTQPNPSRYRAGYLAARAAKDDFAAAFYFNLIPPDERKEVLAQADAEAFAALSKLAYEHRRAERLEEAAALYIEILNVNKAKRGPEDPATIETANDLASIYRRMGQFEKAIPLWEDILKYRKAKFGRENPEALSGMWPLGEAYRNAGRLPEAITLLEEVAAKVPHPVVMGQLLDAYELAGEHAKIIAGCQKQLEEGRKSSPGAEPNTDLLARLGRAYLAQKKWAEAEPHLRECVTLREKTRPDDWTMFDAQSLLGGSLLGQKKYAEAEPLLLKGYEGLKQWEKALEPRDAPRLLEALGRLIELYTAMDKPDEVKKWLEERAKYLDVAPPTREKK
jgi:tetratricopeptide (TPR) repeat protein